MNNSGFLARRLIYHGESGLVDKRCALCGTLLATMRSILSLSLLRITTPHPESTGMGAETTSPCLPKILEERLYGKFFPST